MVELDEDELGAVRDMLDAHRSRPPGGQGSVRPSTLRILPLGGLGEIGKNMTVIEYDGRIVVVDTGLMFPTTEMLGIDLVSPTSPICATTRNRSTPIVLTHGHEDHVGALPLAARGARGAPADLLRAAHGRRWRNRRSRSTSSRTSSSSTWSPVRRNRRWALQHGDDSRLSFDPGRLAVALTCELGTVIVTGDYKFDQTPVDGLPTDAAPARRVRPGGRSCCSAATRPTPTARERRPRRRASGRVLQEVFSRAEGRIVITSLRVQPAPGATGDRHGDAARPAGRAWSGARCERT